MIKKTLLFFSFGILCFSSQSQVLPVEYIEELQCGNWCWAITSHHIINYYGYSSTTLCEVAEYARSRYPDRFGTVNCCMNPTGDCCKTNGNNNSSTYKGSVEDILSHWGLENQILWRPLTLDEITSEIQNGRPFIIRYSGHFVVGYGISGYQHDDIYIINSPWGEEIRNYNSLVNGLNGCDLWVNSFRKIKPCPTYFDISGIQTRGQNINCAGSVDVNCIITNNANIVINAQNGININTGFDVQPGSTIEFNGGIGTLLRTY